MPTRLRARRADEVESLIELVAAIALELAQDRTCAVLRGAACEPSVTGAPAPTYRSGGARCASGPCLVGVAAVATGKGIIRMRTSLGVAAMLTLALFGRGLAASRDDRPARSVEYLSDENGRGNTDEKQVQLEPGPFAPSASGRIAFSVEKGVLSGHIEAQSLPAQGFHAFYVLWFVRTDTNDKAFLGPIVGDGSILFIEKGDGEMTFTAPAFTDGPDKGSPISLGTPGDNFFVVIAEDHIDTFMPFPVSKPPSSFALMATF